MNEAVGSALAGGARTPPTAADGVNMARVITNELDSARFDPLLVRAVARNATSTLELLVTRIDALVSRSSPAIGMSINA
jgi:conserved oligomeric Golgi complex subunit 5